MNGCTAEGMEHGEADDDPGMTTGDRIVAWLMMTGLAVALLQIGQASALPVHLV